MTEADFEKLESVLAADDATFKTDLGDALAGFDQDEPLVELLLEHPDSFEQLSTRVGTIENPGDIAENDPAALEQALRVIYQGMRLIAEQSPEVREAITSDYTVNWEVDDYDLGWHLETDAAAGRLDGGPTLLDDPVLTFVGPLDVLLSMVGDDDFNPTLAFIQNKFELIGPLQKGRELGTMMDAVTENARNLA